MPLLTVLCALWGLCGNKSTRYLPSHGPTSPPRRDFSQLRGYHAAFTRLTRATFSNPEEPVMQIAKNSVVTIDYTLTGPDGQVIDTSVGRQPLPYLHGAGNLIPGLEKQLEGKSAGDTVKTTVAPEEAYGIRDESLTQTAPKSAFQSPNIAVGQQFRADSPQGQKVFTVTKIEGDTVTVDGNHPLAGIPLNFEVNIKDVRAATQEELAHGHVHGPGGHHH